jgi:PKD repeat protein
VPVASFTYSPTEPLTGETVTFTSTSTGATTFDWDLDADGFCDDASGTVVTSAFAIARSYDVKLCAGDGILTATQTQPVLVRNRPPIAAFSLVPAAPVTRQPVTFTSTAVDPDGPIVAQEWDLDGDGAFDDATGETALYYWLRAGTYPVALRVTDRDGAAAVAQTSVVVARRPAGTLSPAPLVRFVGQATATGAHLSLLTVTAPKGAHVGIRCKGGNCPYKHKRFTSKGKRVVLRKLARTYREGTVIEVRITKSETIGKLTRLRMRAGDNPARLDRCIRPGRPNKPFVCKS